ncbi:MAG: hypothetical protein OJF47_000714 [Nitrospira sp.]|nr:MAG: hypothetical protein OJF47_000714 [Nitrospira sp.]
MLNEEFTGRAGIVQRLLQPYRIMAYDLIAPRCHGGLSVFASKTDQNNVPLVGRDLEHAKFASADNQYFFGGKFDLCWQRGLRHWLKTWRPDVVIVEANPRNLTTPLMIRWLHRRSCPVIGHGLGVMPLTSGFEKIRDLGRRGLIGLLDGVLAYSSLAAEQYQSLGMPADRIFVAHNSVSPRPIRQAIQRPVISNQRPIILFIGTLIARKNVDLLLKAVSELRTSPKPILKIIGDGPLKKELEALAASLRGDVQFLGDLRGEKLSNALLEADIFVLPGTGGLAIQEAMAHALPVIVSKADGTETDLVRPENGWIIKPNDWVLLGATIEDALANPARLREMGTASYRIVSSEINIESMCETFLKAMNTIASKPLRKIS